MRPALHCSDSRESSLKSSESLVRREKREIERERGGERFFIFLPSAEELFSELGEQLGVASLAQCHRGVLHDGRVVAVKIQHPDVRKNGYTDMSVIDVRDADMTEIILLTYLSVSLPPLPLSPSSSSSLSLSGPSS